jgi:hypothetical protein
MVIKCASSASKSLITREVHAWFTLATRPPSPDGEYQQFAMHRNPRKDNISLRQERKVLNEIKH